MPLETIQQQVGKLSLVRLHTMMPAFWSPNPGITLQGVKGHPLRSSLEKWSNLYSLEIVYQFRTATDCVLCTQPLRKILLSSPGLRRLKLDIGAPTSGCMISPIPSKYCDLGFVDGEQPLAAPEELQLIRYPFGAPSADSVAMRCPYSDGYPLQIHEQDYWVDNFDWSQLKRLTMSSEPKMALRLVTCVTSICELNLSCGGADDLRECYEQVPVTLEIITVSKFADVGLENIARHGGSLRQLQIHETERQSWANDCIGIDDLLDLVSKCPLIAQNRCFSARGLAVRAIRGPGPPPQTSTPGTVVRGRFQGPGAPSLALRDLPLGGAHRPTHTRTKPAKPAVAKNHPYPLWITSPNGHGPSVAEIVLAELQLRDLRVRAFAPGRRRREEGVLDYVPADYEALWE